METPHEIPVETDRDYRIFYLLMTVVIAAIYVSTLFTGTSLRDPWRLSAYSILLVVHVALHWFLERIATRKWTVIYILVQGFLAFTIVLLSNSTQMIFGLFMPLMGEIAGLLGLNRTALVAIGYYALLSVADFLLINNELKTGAWVLIIIPAAFFTILYTTMYVRQAQARERAQGLLKELETANRQLSQYAAQVEDLTIASERQRMARELHDTLSQGLAGLILQLEAADAHLAGNRPEKARIIVRETMEHARFTLGDARRAIDDLRSTGMPGLAEAARQEAGRFITATGIPCEVEIFLPVQLPDLVTEAATRAISEGLTNVARHARAKNARLRIAIAEERNELEIEINDDGIGFNPDVTESGHYGLLGMRERVRLAGGRLEVHSQDGKGTQLVIHFPLEKSLDE
jgi:two-component system, NarL family, sensor histidine kinase YdfH